MYNRYIPDNTCYEPVHEKGRTPASLGHDKNAQRPPSPPTKGANPLDGIIGGLSGLLKNLHIQKLDSGDLLLVLILLFLFLERDDNLELVITLGLLLLFGLFGDEDADPHESPSPTT